MIRRSKRTVPLALDEEIEESKRAVFFGAHWGARDPADEIEEKDLFMRIVEQAVEQIVTFPARQRRALLCELRERLEGEMSLEEICEKWSISREEMCWPEDKQEKQRLKALLPVARRRLVLIHELLLN